MNPFDTEFETLTLLKQVCDQSTTNEEKLENLKLLKIQQECCLEFLNITIKQLVNDAERTEKKIRELDSIVKNRRRHSDSYYRDINHKKENR